MLRAIAAAALMAACGRPEAPSPAACAHDTTLPREGHIEVKMSVPPARLRRDMDLHALAVESKGTVGLGAGPQGLTEVEHRLDVRTLMSLTPASGGACVWFEKVTIDLSPGDVAIFVPSEYPEDSCEYLAVLDHERGHERVHRERLEKAATEMQAALDGAKWLPLRGNPAFAADKDAAQKALEDKIRKVVHPAFEKFKWELTIAQAELDTPALYRWVTARCQDWKHAR